MELNWQRTLMLNSANEHIRQRFVMSIVSFMCIGDVCSLSVSFLDTLMSTRNSVKQSYPCRWQHRPLQRLPGGKRLARLLVHSPPDQAHMQAIIQHPRMPVYLRKLYTEMLSMQAGSSRWTWRLDFVLEQYHVNPLCYMCASVSQYPADTLICAWVGWDNWHSGCCARCLVPIIHSACNALSL